MTVLARLGLLTKIVALAAAAPMSTPATLDLAGGGTMSLDEQRGRIVVVNFWATWCVPCRRELAELDQFAIAHRDQVAAVAVLAERRPDPRLVDRQIAALHIPVALRFAAGGGRFPLVNNGVPTTYVLDRSGRIVLVKGGAFRPGDLGATVQRLLGDAGKGAP